MCIDAPLPLPLRITRLERPSYRPAKWDKGNSKRLYSHSRRLQTKAHEASATSEYRQTVRHTSLHAPTIDLQP